MEKFDIYGYGYGTVWRDVCVYHKEAYSTSVSDFHKHDFYEINFIISGNVKALIKNHSEEGTASKIVLAKPGDAHFVSCLPDTLYKRIYLVFTREFIENGSADWMELSEVFGEHGSLITINEDECEKIKNIMEQIGEEKTNLSKRMLIYYLLSYIKELRKDNKSISHSTPLYVFEALSYIENHPEEKIVSSLLAERLHIGRTALLTEFKRYTGMTLGGYLDLFRLRRATYLISRGEKLEHIARMCGFADTSGLIRCFKRHYGMTPLQHARAIKN